MVSTENVKFLPDSIVLDPEQSVDTTLMGKTKVWKSPMGKLQRTRPCWQPAPSSQSSVAQCSTIIAAFPGQETNAVTAVFLCVIFMTHNVIFVIVTYAFM